MKAVSIVLVNAVLGFSCNAFAQANDPSGGQCAGLDPAGQLFSTCLQAHSAARLIEHLEAMGANANAVTQAQLRLDAALAEYAELSGGGTVPGFEIPETLLAVAYIDRQDDGGGYDAAQDTLIAKWVDANRNGLPDVGDEIVTNQYPTDLDATGVGNFGILSHTVAAGWVIEVDQDPYGPYFLIASNVFADPFIRISFGFGVRSPLHDNPLFPEETYIEIKHDAINDVALGRAWFLDNGTDLSSQGDFVLVEGTSASDADTLVNLLEPSCTRYPLPCDDPFIDVELLFGN